MSYWSCVGAMVLRVRRGAKGVSRVLIPHWRIEQWMWLVWWPLIAAWIVLPFWITARGARLPAPLLPPELLRESLLFEFARWCAAGAAVLALRMSITCWRHMGRHWRMGVDPSQELELLTDGPFSWVRHPIYSLGMLIMLCTLVVVPSPVTLTMAAVHVLLLHLKATNEENFLREKFGAVYDEYRRAVPRLVPKPSRFAAALRGEKPSTPTATARTFKNGTLNRFQQAMLTWEQLHPYNSVHAVRLPGEAEPAQLEHAVRAACDELGIGDLHLHAAPGRFGYSKLSMLPIMQLADATDDCERLSRAAADALNTPFPPGPFSPLRWYVWNNHETHRHWILLAYRHVISDGTAAQNLLMNVMRRYAGDDPATATAARTKNVFSTESGVASPIRRAGAWRCLRDVLRIHRTLRCSHKMPDERGGGDAVHVQIASLSLDETEAIGRACAKAGAGLNDVLLAAMATAIAEATPDRRVSRRRRKIALATILSTRRRDEIDVSFDTQIADAIVPVDRPDAPFDDVLRQIVTGLHEWKEDRSRAEDVAAMRFWLVRRVWPLFGLPHDRRSYRKVFPICGGVSTTVVSGHDEFFRRRIEQYVRVVPCGPAAPLALAATMYDGRLELALTHRLSSKSDEQAADLLAAVRRKLEAWAHDSSGSTTVDGVEPVLTVSTR